MTNAFPPPASGPDGFPGQGSGFAPNGQPYSDKSKVVAGILGILLGCFGAGRFYTGHVKIGLAQFLTSLCFGAGAIWALVDGIMILVKGGTDAEGRVLRD